MQSNTSNAKDTNEALLLPEGVTWEGIVKALQEEKGQQFLKKIAPATFKYILEENNRPKAIQSLIKTLKKIDPQNANREYAEMMFGAMQKVAQTVNDRKNTNKSIF